MFFINCVIVNGRFFSELPLKEDGWRIAKFANTVILFSIVQYLHHFFVCLCLPNEILNDEAPRNILL